ncbi:DUF2634 domain-containing protein [Lactobacillus hominis]|uniref:Phage protein n=1 Tax=Lactobacillus hominis DSM 23910 = CRBIP 24.179 TaxID=1423758 RepID=I7L606_9LACO|nr:DUF2634 domain-containing protein [Lactobacillus hominis]KRM85742.1 phage protein [Lactobacillus hominis DSM 23910 = CRBIP 24.179]MCT3347211.1 DUF2634 domain-containing protein [Lactobacillus hominis]CCI81737.1 Putative uncharacterized protein orf52 [Lactobacillus hominis DSM 23910 = CRBIP 24.179]
MDNEDTNPTLTFQVAHGRIRNKFDGLQAMVQAVDKILKTERFVYPIYSDQYGNDLNELLGKGFDYAKVEVERMTKEALLADDRVISVKINSIKQTDSTTLSVTGTCLTSYGDIPIESEVEVKK